MFERGGELVGSVEEVEGLVFEVGEEESSEGGGLDGREEGDGLGQKTNERRR